MSKIDVDKLQTIAAAVQTVESIASSAVATVGTAPTSDEKLRAAISIASAVDPKIAAQASEISVIVGSLVSIFNLFGIFKKKAVAPAAPSNPA